MVTINSLDPRILRENIPEDLNISPLNALDNFETYEVFHQTQRGGHHVHVGSVHAPSPELAFVFAKEQFARRDKTVNLWVVRSSDVFTTSYDDADMFATAPEKMYREAGGYKVMKRINKYKKENAQ